jgi:hypothetical protein
MTIRRHKQKLKDRAVCANAKAFAQTHPEPHPFPGVNHAMLQSKFSLSRRTSV